MKKIKNSIMFLFVITIFLTSNVFATTPIPGINIIMKKNPGAIAVANSSSDSKGKFSFNNLEEGIYDITISYNEIIKTVCQIEKNNTSEKNIYEFTLTLDGTGVIIKDSKTPAKLLITNQTGVISISIPKGGVSVSGALIYEKMDQANGQSTGTIKLTKPGKDDKVDIDSKQPITFEWTSTNVKGPHTLKLFVVEKGQTPEQAMKDKPVYEKKGITTNSEKVPFAEFSISQPGIKIMWTVSAGGDVVSPYQVITTSRSNIKHQNR